MSNRDERLSEMHGMFNVIGICGDAQTVARLIGFHEDERDYYYHVRFIGGKETRWSAVGWFIPLRGAIEERAYAFLEQVFCLNGCPPADEFVITLASEAENEATYGSRR